jgi:hypothetical protein
MPNELPYLRQGNESHDGQKQVFMSKKNKKKKRIRNSVWKMIFTTRENEEPLEEQQRPIATTPTSIFDIPITGIAPMTELREDHVICLVDQSLSHASVTNKRQTYILGNVFDPTISRP